jgi:hypothetical protein
MSKWKLIRGALRSLAHELADKPGGLKIAKERIKNLPLSEADVDPLKGWHVSPHLFDKFDLSKIGSGEGAQVFGHGGYLAEADAVKDYYFKSFKDKMAHIKRPDDEALAKVKDRIAEAENRLNDIIGGRDFDELSGDEIDETITLYDEIHKLNEQALMETIARGPKEPVVYRTDFYASPDELLDWDKPLSEQGKVVRDMIESDPIYSTMKARESELSANLEEGLRSMGWDETPTMSHGELIKMEMELKNLRSILNTSYGKGNYIYRSMSQGNPAFASKELRSRGIKGIRYLDGNSRGAGEGTYNYVFFDDGDVRVRSRDDEPMPYRNGGALRRV